MLSRGGEINHHGRRSPPRRASVHRNPRYSYDGNTIPSAVRGRAEQPAVVVGARGAQRSSMGASAAPSAAAGGAPKQQPVVGGRAASTPPPAVRTAGGARRNSLSTFRERLDGSARRRSLSQIGGAPVMQQQQSMGRQSLGGRPMMMNGQIVYQQGQQQHPQSVYMGQQQQQQQQQPVYRQVVQQPQQFQRVQQVPQQQVPQQQVQQQQLSPPKATRVVSPVHLVHSPQRPSLFSAMPVGHGSPVVYSSPTSGHGRPIVHASPVRGSPIVARPLAGESVASPAVEDEPASPTPSSPNTDDAALSPEDTVGSYRVTVTHKGVFREPIPGAVGSPASTEFAGAVPPPAAHSSPARTPVRSGPVSSPAHTSRTPTSTSTVVVEETVTTTREETVELEMHGSRHGPDPRHPFFYLQAAYSDVRSSLVERLEAMEANAEAVARLHESFGEVRRTVEVESDRIQMRVHDKMERLRQAMVEREERIAAKVRQMGEEKLGEIDAHVDRLGAKRERLRELLQTVRMLLSKEDSNEFLDEYAELLSVITDDDLAQPVAVSSLEGDLAAVQRWNLAGLDADDAADAAVASVQPARIGHGSPTAAGGVNGAPPSTSPSPAPTGRKSRSPGAASPPSPHKTAVVPTPTTPAPHNVVAAAKQAAGPLFCAYTLNAHVSDVTALATWNGELISASRDGSIFIWNLETLEMAELFAGRHAITSMVVSETAAVLYAAATDDSIKAFDLNKFKPLGSFTGHSGLVLDLHVCGDYLVSASHDRTLRVWENGVGCVATLEGHTAPVSSVVSSNGLLYSGSYDRSIRVWNLDDFACERTIVAHEDYVRCLVANMQWLYSAGNDSTVRVWSLDTLECVAIIRAHESAVRSLLLSGAHLYSGGDDGDVIAFSLTTLARDDKQTSDASGGHESSVTALARVDGGVASGSRDRTIKLWLGKAAADEA